MKHLFVTASLALGLCGCAESPSVLQILQTSALDNACLSSGTVGRPSGSLNLAYGRNYFLGFKVGSTYQNTGISVSGVPLDPTPAEGGQATILLDSATVSYSVSPNVRVPSSTLKFTGSIAPNSTNNTVILNLLSQDASDALAAGVPAGEVYRLTATVQLEGKLSTGGGKIESNEFVYYIDLVNNPPAAPLPACQPGTQPVGPCGSAGQDGAIPTCQ